MHLEITLVVVFYNHAIMKLYQEGIQREVKGEPPHSKPFRIANGFFNEADITISYRASGSQMPKRWASMEIIAREERRQWPTSKPQQLSGVISAISRKFYPDLYALLPLKSSS